MAKNTASRTQVVRALTKLVVIMVVVRGVKKTGNTKCVTSIRKSRKVGEMMDREKVIKGLECCLNETKSLDNEPCGECPYGAAGGGCVDQLNADALALLKEQDVVQCKDCEDACICSDDWVICTHIDSNGNDKHPADWFCADGERREGR